MKKHPLVLWMENNGLKAWKFADQNKIARRTVYALVSGENRNPSIGLLDKIAVATGGAVTVQEQSDWALGKRNKIAQPDTEPGEPPESEEPAVIDEAEDPDERTDDDADLPPEIHDL